MRVPPVLGCAQKFCQILIVASAMVQMSCSAASDVDLAARAYAIPRVESDYISSLLGAYHWDLSKAYSADGTQELDWTSTWRPVLRMDFFSQHLETQVCGFISWPYTLTPNRGIQLGPRVMTTGLCDDGDGGVMRLQSRVNAHMQNIAGYDLQIGNNDISNRLVLRFKDGSRWEMSSVPNEETRYGSKAHTVQFEIEPKLVPCEAPKSVKRSCMRVRQMNWEVWPEVAYSEWQTLEKIEGFTHQKGWHTRIYVTRYRLRKTPADAVVYVYRSYMTRDEIREAGDYKPEVHR